MTVRLAIIFIALWTFGFCSPVLAQSNKKPKKSVKQLKRELSTVNKKRQDLRRAIAATKRQKGAILGDIEWVDRNLEGVEQSMDKTGDQLVANKNAQAQLAQELEVATKRMAERKEKARRRLRNMYMSGDDDGALALLGSQDLSEMAAKKTVMERMASEDRRLFADLRELRTDIASKKAKQDRLVAEKAQLLSRQRNYQNQLQVAKVKKKSLVNELNERQGELAEELDQLEEESNTIAAQIRAYAAAQRRRGAAPLKFGGRFIRPVNSRITSGFGYRFHPILKRRRLHAGIDFGAPTGTPIRASAAGVVIQANYRRGYGNTVVIDHGGGYTTLYGHCSRLFVAAGQRVTQGQVIAAVGSTGLSTGPHLHFEIRVNGNPVNPMGRL